MLRSRSSMTDFTYSGNILAVVLPFVVGSADRLPGVHDKTCQEWNCPVNDTDHGLPAASRSASFSMALAAVADAWSWAWSPNAISWER